MIMANLKIVTLNCHGLRNKSKRRSLFKLFKEKKFDIICLQETYITDAVSDLWKLEWGGELIYEAKTNHSLGTTILLKKGFQHEVKVITKTARILGVEIKTESGEMQVFNLYAPNQTMDKLQFFNDLQTILSNNQSEQLVLCGDLNTVLDNEKDIISGAKHPENVVTAFNDLKNEGGLNDAWRMFHAQEKEFSWSSKNNFIARRIDYILASDWIMNNILECNMFSTPHSDHRYVYIELNCKQTVRGPGIWKFNNSLLKDIEFVNRINRIIDDSITDYTEYDDQVKWELIKRRLKDESIEYSKSKAVKRKNERIELSNKLNECDKLLSNDPDNENLKTRRHDICLQLELHEYFLTQSAIIRAREKWIQEGEKNSKYFLQLEKSRANAKIMNTLQYDGKIITNQNEILKAQKEHFEQLYSKKDESENLSNDLDDFLEDCEVPKLNDEDRDSCEGRITVEEAGIALSQLKNDSSPGSDGLTTEFYKFFWPKLCNLVVKTFNSGFEKGHLSGSQSTGIITLLHKGNDLSRENLNNWRPITLLNTDYKILAKCLALRIAGVITELVSHEQVGFIKGRNISSILRLVDDVIEHANINNLSGAIVAVDLKKAFDSVSKDFMIETFSRFGFGREFITWFKVINENTCSSVGYSGWVSEDFKVERGVRQGCCLSPLAFVLSLELLAIKLRQSRNIQGIKIKGGNSLSTVLRIALYADDITLFLKNKDDLEAALGIFSQFSIISGLEINKNKTEAMWIGTHANHGEACCELKWKKKIKILGIVFSVEKPASENEENWEKRIENIKKITGRWQKRNLGYLGKVCIINSFIIPQLVYVMKAICLPEKVIHSINTILYRFLWKRKNTNKKAFEKVRRKVINSDFEKGGLRFRDIKTLQESFLLEWIVKIYNASENDKWSYIPSYELLQFGKEYAGLRGNVQWKKFRIDNIIISSFWKQALKTWVDNNAETTPNNASHSVIWNNQNITYRNQVLFYKKWAQRGIIYVNDILEGNNIVSLQQIEEKLGRSPSLMLEYNVVWNAVSAFLANHEPLTVEVALNRDILLFDSKQLASAKSFRLSLVEKRFTEPCAVQFWQRKFNTELTKWHWTIIRQASKESRLRELHWKILHNIYPTNIVLHKMGLRQNNRCTYCSDKVDFIEHFFVECPQISKIWKHVQNVLNDEQNLKITLLPRDILLGFEKRPGTTKIDIEYINHLIIIAKMCIGKFRYASPINIVCLFDMELDIRRKLRLV